MDKSNIIKHSHVNYNKPINNTLFYIDFIFQIFVNKLFTL